jgi:hypothetical protein
VGRGEGGWSTWGERGEGKGGEHVGGGGGRGGGEDVGRAGEVILGSCCCTNGGVDNMWGLWHYTNLVMNS